MLRTYLFDRKAFVALFLLLLSPSLVAQSLIPYAPILPGRTGHTGQILPDDIYVFGGMDSAGNYLNTAEYVHHCNGCNWTALAPMPTARAHASSTRLPNGNILVIGGRNATGYVGAVEEYNPTSNTWVSHPPVPTAYGHADAVYMGGMVHVFGGYDGTNVLSLHVAYDLGTFTWNLVSIMPLALMDLQVGLLNMGGDEVFIAGGRTVPGNPTAISGAMFRYSAATGTYTNMPPMPTPRAGFAMGAENQWFKRIVVFGGHTANGGMTANVEMYDAFANNWTSYQPLSSPRADFWGDGFWDITTVCAFSIVAIGGLDSTGNVSTLAEAYYLLPGPFDISDLEFYGISTGPGIDLSWTLQEEAELSHFSLSHGQDGVNFEPLAASVPANGAEEWTYHHNLTDPGMQFYQLQAYDIDGQLIYSRDLTVLNANDPDQTFRFFPNPATDRVSFAFTEADGDREVTLFTTDGKAVYRETIGPNAGWELYMGDLPRGLYLLRVKNGETVDYQRMVLE